MLSQMLGGHNVYVNRLLGAFGFLNNQFPGNLRVIIRSATRCWGQREWRGLLGPCTQ